MKNKQATWWQGFLQAEEHYKEKAFVENSYSGRLKFNYAEGGSIEYLGDKEPNYQFECGMRDYIDQYESVIKGVLK